MTSMEMDPAAAHALSVAASFHSALEGQLNQMNEKSFRAFDETKTVEVTINGHQWLTGLHIENGLLRECGAQVVAARVNEALQNAQNAATVHNTAAGEALAEALSAMSKSLYDGPA